SNLSKKFLRYSIIARQFGDSTHVFLYVSKITNASLIAFKRRSSEMSKSFFCIQEYISCNATDCSLSSVISQTIDKHVCNFSGIYPYITHGNTNNRNNTFLLTASFIINSPKKN